MKISQIYTTQKANDGVTIPVEFFKGKKKPTLTVYGQDSQKFRDKFEENYVEQARIQTLPKNEQDEAFDAANLHLVAQMVKTWSFEEPCTLENVKTLMMESPGVFDLVNTSVFDRSLFVG